MQHSYFTPIKTINSYSKKMNNSDGIQRQGDWVCFNCQNLNYSFRKKCNRCKTQTREDNDKRSVYSYYYYPKMEQNLQTFDIKRQPVNDEMGSFSSYSDGYEIKQFSEQNKQNLPFEMNRNLQTPKKKKPLLSTQNSKLDGLPSVSPLVKKYRKKEQYTTLSKIENCKASSSQYSRGQQSQENIKIRDFDKLIQQLNGNKTFEGIQGSPFKQIIDDDDTPGYKFMKQIEQSISKIII